MMTGKERLLAAMRGEKVDRVPIWFRKEIAVLNGPAGSDNFYKCWQDEPLYRELVKDLSPYADIKAMWGIVCMNRFITTDPSFMDEKTEQISDDLIRKTTTIRTPRKDLINIDEFNRGESAGWCAKPAVNSVEELKILMKLPWEPNLDSINKAVNSYKNALKDVGDRGVPNFWVESPIVCISGCMSFELFLELSLTENELFHELCKEITRRELILIDTLFASGVKIEGIATIGGSEQCTPPMMRPTAFDEFVVPYDGQLVKRLQEKGLLVNMHCHGKVKHALKCMVDMGVDSTDPVEPPPAGDCTYAEAREIVGDKLTIFGNLEFDELEFGEPQQIKNHVKEIMSLGKRRLVLSASSGPITTITPRLADNYRAWVEAAIN